MKHISENKASIIRWTATDLGVQLKLFVYDDAERFLLPCHLEISGRMLASMLQDHQARLEAVDTMLPPWSE